MHFPRTAAWLSLSLTPFSTALAIFQASSSNLDLRDAPQKSLPVHVIHEFPVGTSLENLAVRQNGKVLATVISHPELYQLDPIHGGPPELVSNNFGPVLGLLGIVETWPDIFYVVAANFSAVALAAAPGSNSVWKVDLTSSRIPAPTTKIADVPDGGALNGMALLNEDKGHILIADLTVGVVWRLNVLNGEVLRIIEVPAMLPPPPPALKFGVNGIKVRDGALYFTNSGFGALYRLPIHADGTAAGNVSAVASGIDIVDDFQFNDEGDAFVTQNSSSELVEVTHEGMKRLLVDNTTLTLPNPTAAQFGRTSADRGSLYISEDGNSTRGGRLSKVDIGNEYWGKRCSSLCSELYLCTECALEILSICSVLNHLSKFPYGRDGDV